MTFDEKTQGMDGSSLVENLLEEWITARERGENLSLDDLCAKFPHIAAELRLRIQAVHQTPAPASRPDQKPTSKSRDGASDSVAVPTTQTLKAMSEITELEFHAKGGLGAVFSGTEENLNRRVAIKFLHRTLLQHRASREQFRLEAEVTGRLEHPGIVPLYGIGMTDDGQPFYTMRFIDGETMDDAIHRFHRQRSESRAEAQQSLEFRRLLNAFVSVCRTIAYAHNRGIVHRDIKPANIMLGRYGETLVVDWGLAISVDRDDRFRNSGEVTLVPESGSHNSGSGGGAGTLAYMSPEQASDLAPTPASDIYSLGATLYKILCGQAAFSGENGLEIRTRVIEGRFARPSSLVRTIPQSLEAICLKAMQLRPNDRYATANDVALDIESYLADEAVSVQPDSLMQRAARWTRRHRSAAQSVIAAIMLVVMVSIIAAIWLGALAKKEAEARLVADDSRRLAESARKENLQTSAKAMAQAIGYEIDLRWRLLEAEAQSQVLRLAIAAANADPQNKTLWEPIQAWLTEQRGLRGSSVQNSNWSVFSDQGLQYARSPRGSSIGNLYRHRDYFHGLGEDMTKEDPRVPSLKPLEFLLPKLADHSDAVNLSCVYQSTATDRLVVSFSVPIWDSEDPVARRISGLLAMTLEIDDFGIQNNAMLFQVETNQITGQPGMVIAHPRLKERRKDAPFPRVNDDVLNVAKGLQEESGQAVAIVENFEDPVTGTRHLAAISPVIVRSRPEEVRNIGWFLVVTEE